MRRQLRRRGDNDERYREKKRSYKELCEEKKRKEQERWEKDGKGAKTEGQVWKIVNSERKRRIQIEEKKIL